MPSQTLSDVLYYRLSFSVAYLSLSFSFKSDFLTSHFSGVSSPMLSVSRVMSYYSMLKKASKSPTPPYLENPPTHEKILVPLNTEAIYDIVCSKVRLSSVFPSSALQTLSSSSLSSSLVGSPFYSSPTTFTKSLSTCSM